MKTLTKVLIVLLVSCFVAAANGASFEVFLKIDGIEGDSTVVGHEGEIKAISFKMGVLQTGTFAVGGGGGAGRAEFTPLTVYKFIDKASPQLFLAAAFGDHIRRATLVVRRSGPNPFEFFKIALLDVIISSVNDQSSATAQNSNLVEPITLSYGLIAWAFIPENPDGSPGVPIKAWFDLKTVKGGPGGGPAGL
jgi:type VI secretion system secreted protein Hcp